MTYLSCYCGSYKVAAFYKKVGANPNDAASLSILLSLQNISTGKLIFSIPFPLRIFLPILLIMNVSTFFC